MDSSCRCRSESAERIGGRAALARIVVSVGFDTAFAVNALALAFPFLLLWQLVRALISV